MKNFISVMIAGGLWLGLAVSSHAVLVPLKDAFWSGTITTSGASASEPLVNTPITKATLISLFAPGQVTASNTALYVNSSSLDILLMSKDGSELYVVVTDTVTGAEDNLSLSGKSGGQGKTFLKSNLFNSNLGGNVFMTRKVTIVRGGFKITFKASIFGTGTVGDAGAPNAVANATISGTVIIPADQ